MKILNLYCGIGGNRELWGNEHNITAVELNEKVAFEYQRRYPNDTVIVGDAHEYLLNHHKQFEFIWSSPPCQSHSRTNYFLNKRGVERYPDMNLYQEIILLQTFCKGLFCVENVRGYYKPLIVPIELGRHYFWTNFNIIRQKFDNISIGKMCGKNQTQRRESIEMVTVKRYGIDLTETKIKNKQQVIRNMVDPELTLHILNCALGKSFNKKNLYAGTLFENEM